MLYIYTCYQTYNIKIDLLKDKILDYKNKSQTQTYQAKEINKQDEDKGSKIIEKFEKHYKDLEQQKTDSSL